MREEINTLGEMITFDPVPHPVCLHVLNGRTELPKACTRAYECWHCAFDQWLDAIDEERAELAKAA
jgi:hypothetical protein